MQTFVDVISGDVFFCDTIPSTCTKKFSMENACMRVQAKDSDDPVIVRLERQL